VDPHYQLTLATIFLQQVQHIYHALEGRIAPHQVEQPRQIVLNVLLEHIVLQLLQLPNLLASHALQVHIVD